MARAIIDEQRNFAIAKKKSNNIVRFTGGDKRLDCLVQILFEISEIK